MAHRALTILIAGTGRLAKVLAEAGVRTSAAGTIAVVGRNSAARDALLAAVPGLQAGEPEWASRADLLVLAVSPHAYREVLTAFTPHLAPSTIVVSVTNGVALETIGRWTANPVVKAIPTIAQAVGRGAVPVVAGPAAKSSDVALVKDWFVRFGLPADVTEADIRVASNVAGSAIAIFALFARAFVSTNAVRANDVSRSSLDTMIAESLVATGELLRRGYDYEAIISSTATPLGVTEAVIDPLARIAPALCERMIEAGIRRQSELQADQGG
ncbi:NADP oxidoreductase [Hyphomicrobiales bacterium]|nr:NADP oxidoreductase [Hyphomicrobiales bacterium]CAH1698351.1 NADP oxidoreductase [Hyphomicrobiales bacterium]CAI0342006.1 NADP oxidoreductase [Hyphomicrobiales bacterium]